MNIEQFVGDGRSPLSIAVPVILILLLLAAAVLLIRKPVKGKKGNRIADTGESTTTPLASPPSGEDMSVSVPKRGWILIGNAQHVGARSDQQDSFGISNAEMIARSGLLAVVADGMGGLSNGAVYSRAAVQAALHSFNTEAPEKDDEATLLRVLKRAREAVADTGRTDGGTTFIAVLIRDRLLHFVSVGDSRISLMRNGGLIQLNREHVYGRELDDLALNGLLSSEEAASDRQRHAITSYLGKQDSMSVDRNIQAISLFSGDKIILMSDGVYNSLSEQELTSLLLQDPARAAEAIQQAVIGKGNPHQDNMTIIILEIE